MGQILKDIYTDVSIATLLGFKGGTGAYFLYGLPRFSVDLDFDLLAVSEENKKVVFERIKSILGKYGELKDGHIKRFTIFFLLSYGDADHNIKVEINTREIVSEIKNRYELKEYLGISMLAGKKEYLFAGKLAALTSRGETATRDMYDIYYFAKNNWDIDEEIISAQTGKPTKEHLVDCLAVIERVKENQMLSGLGELLDEKEKNWVKQNLKKEAIFMLKNYISALQ